MTKLCKFFFSDAENAMVFHILKQQTVLKNVTKRAMLSRVAHSRLVSFFFFL